MQRCLKPASVLALSLLIPAAQAVTVDVGVDPAQTWWGYTAVLDLPSAGGAFRFSEFYADDLTRLPGGISGAAAWLQPNPLGVLQSDTASPFFDFWWAADGNGGYSANKSVLNRMYVQNDSLAGNTVRFSGQVLDNTLSAPYVANAFIVVTVGDDFAFFAQQTVPLVAGQAFSVSLDVAAGYHVGYGIEVIGPSAPGAAFGSLGAVSVSAVPEPSTWLLMALGGAGLLARRQRR